jgi:adenylyl-sulfate kinase
MSGSSEVVWHPGHVPRADRSELTGGPGLVVWFTGLSGSGKSTVAVEVERRLVASGRAAYLLDGDNLRHGLCSDLGFSAGDRDENVRRVGEVAALFADAGLVALVPLVSPYSAARDLVRERVETAGLRFVEVHVATPLEECERRDPKGLYAKARAGEIKHFTGIDDPYEEPLGPLRQGAGGAADRHDRDRRPVRAARTSRADPGPRRRHRRGAGRLGHVAPGSIGTTHAAALSSSTVGPMSEVEVVRSIYDAMAAGDVGRLLELIDESVVIIQDPALPWGGRHEGHDGFAEFALTLTGTIESEVTHGALFMADGEVFQYGRTAGRVRSNGATFDIPEVHRWVVRDGKAVEARFAIDTGAMLAVLDPDRDQV